MSRHRIFDSFREALQPKPEAGAWMLLAEAAALLRDAERGSDLDRMSLGLGESEDSLLAFWAQRVAQVGVAIYGSRIMSTQLERIPDDVVRNGQIRDQATRLETIRGTPIKDYGALQVKRREFEAYLQRAQDAPPQA